LKRAESVIPPSAFTPRALKLIWAAKAIRAFHKQRLLTNARQALAQTHRALFLAVSAPNRTPLVADCQLMSAGDSPPPEDCAAVLCCHSRQKAVFATPRDALRLPRSLAHNVTLSLLSNHAAA
jgi:hypothetical protein